MTISRSIYSRATALVIAAVMLFTAVPALATEAGEVLLRETATMPAEGGTQTYSFTLSAPSAVTLRVDCPPQASSSYKFTTSLFDSDDTLLLSFSTIHSDSFIEQRNYLAAGTYTVKVAETNSRLWHIADPYTLTVSAEENKGQFEIESNNTRETASPITLNESITGRLHINEDVDFYQITLPQAGRLNLTFRHPNVESTSTYWRVTLFDATTATCLEMSVAGNQTVSTAIPAYLAAGTYTLRVMSPHSFLYHSAADYSITSEFTANAGAFEIEPNNQLAEASPIAGATLTTTGNLSSADDVDYYRFTVTSAGSVQLRVTHNNTERSGESWQVQLYDATDAQLLTLRVPGDKTVLDTEAVTLQPGVYSLKVTSPYSMYYSGLDYSIALSGTATILRNDAPSSWAAETVQLAVAAGLVPPSLQSSYTANITRAEFCQLIVVYLERANNTTIDAFLAQQNVSRSDMSFSDTTDSNVLAASALRIVAGVGDGRFAPTDSITREQAAVMLTRLAAVMGEDTQRAAPTFADAGSISIWATAEVGYVSAAGIMTGNNNLFSPADNYSREQAILTFYRIFTAS